MRTLLLACLLWTHGVFATTGTPNNFNVGKSLKVSTGYVTSQSKFDGSFETSNTGWTASVGTIVRTASTESEGSYIGRWSGTGTGTLDIGYTSATATGTMELSEWTSLDTPADYAICAVVNSVETGCKQLSNSDTGWKNLSVIADSVKSAGLLLRLKHTGSGAFTADVDDAKISPNLWKMAQTVEQESVSYTGYSSGASPVVFKTLDTARTSTSTIISHTASRFTILKACNAITSASNINSLGSINFRLKHYNSSGTLIKESGSSISINGVSENASISTRALSGDYFEVSADSTPTDSVTTNFSITCSSIRDNVVVSESGVRRVAVYGSGNNGAAYTADTPINWTEVEDSTNSWDGSSFTVPETGDYDISGVAAFTTSAGYSISVYKDGVSSGVKIGDNTASASSIVFSGKISLIKGQVVTIRSQVSGTLSNTGIHKLSIVKLATIDRPLYALPTSKENVFSASFSSAAAILTKNLDWINSSTNDGTGAYTVDYTKLGLSSAPSVVVSPLLVGYDFVASVYSVTATQAKVRVTVGNSGALSNQGFSITLQKRSPDYTAPGVMLLNVPAAGMNYTDGAPDKVHNFSFSYGTTNATTICSASPCSYLDQIGNYVTNVVLNSTGNYTANFTKTFSKLKCVTMVTDPVQNNVIPYSGYSCSSCSSINFITLTPASSTKNTYGTIMCQGQI